MKKTTILVPTDFSDCANNALKYAVGLASDLKADLVLLHSIIYNDSAFISPKDKEEENTRRFNEAQEKLGESLNLVKKEHPHLSVKTLLESGGAELTVSSVIDSEKIDYVVMGTEGASGLKAAVFGSFTSNVLLISPVPVFTIPNGTYQGYKNILCTTEMDETEMNAVKKTIELAEKFKSRVTFYNVNPDEKEQQALFTKFEKRIKEISPYELIDYVTVESHDIVGSIDNYVSSEKPDLVITLGKERSFFDKFFGKKVTKKLSLHTHTPLLSFPSYH